jgi:hypothetical protein
MPTVEELQSIADMGRENPAIDSNYFPTLGMYGDPYYSNYYLPYWSSSAVANDTDLAWDVELDFGQYWLGYKYGGLAVRLVRSQ